MKKFILITLIGCFICFETKAQSPLTNITVKIQAARKANGVALVHNEDGKFKIYAVFKNEKVTDYYAVDMNGKRINPTYASSTGGVSCTVCIKSPAGTICYEIDCDDVPIRKKDKAA